MKQQTIYTQSLILEDEPEKSSEEPSEKSRKRANDLDGKTWLRYSISVWSDIHKSSKETELGHPAIFPAELVSRLIQIFTNSEQRVVFDPFAGTGSTLVAAQHLGKDGIGIELNPEFAEKARLRCDEKELFDTVKQVMRGQSYCCIVVMDIRKKNKFYPFHSDVANFMQAIGFVYDDMIIWDRRHEYNNMRPLGYPSVFRVNKAHEFILIFQKPVI